MWQTVFIVAAIILVPCGFVGAIMLLEARGLKKELAVEDNEQLIPLQIHGSRVMLTAAEYEAHLEDTAAPSDDCFSRF